MSFKEECDDRGQLQSSFPLLSWPPRWACPLSLVLPPSLRKLQTPHVGWSPPCPAGLLTQWWCLLIDDAMWNCPTRGRAQRSAVTARPQGQGQPCLLPVTVQQRLPVGLVQNPWRWFFSSEVLAWGLTTNEPPVERRGLPPPWALGSVSVGTVLCAVPPSPHPSGLLSGSQYWSPLFEGMIKGSPCHGDSVPRTILSRSRSHSQNPEESRCQGLKLSLPPKKGQEVWSASVLPSVPVLRSFKFVHPPQRMFGRPSSFSSSEKLVHITWTLEPERSVFKSRHFLALWVWAHC